MTFSDFLLPSATAAAIFVGMASCQADDTNGLNLSREEYADGKKRSAAAFKKVAPGLKEAFARKELTWQAPIFLRAFKDERILEVWVKKEDRFVLFKKYPVLGQSGDPGPKLQQGDRQVPEGFYFVTPRQMNSKSKFHLSFNIGYPNAYDRAHDRTGDFIMIHGSNVSIGCLAMGDDGIEEIYTLARAAFQGGQDFFRVHLFPFRMTEPNLRKGANHRWGPFWQNLQTGYQWFEEKKVPPNVTVKDKRYLFD